MLAALMAVLVATALMAALTAAALMAPLAVAALIAACCFGVDNGGIDNCPGEGGSVGDCDSG